MSRFKVLYPISGARGPPDFQISFPAPNLHLLSLECCQDGTVAAPEVDCRPNLLLRLPDNTPFRTKDRLAENLENTRLFIA